MNKVLIVGTLGRDPEMKTLESGKMLCELAIATEDRVKVDGEWTKKTDWHNVTLWDKRAESAVTYLRKGSKVSIEGKLQIRSWEKDGKKQYKTEVIVSEIEFITLHAKGEAQQETPVKPKQAKFKAPAEDEMPF